MKTKIPHLCLLVVLTAAFVPAHAQTNLPSFPQGCVTWNLRPGWNAVGIPVLRPAVLSGIIQQVDAPNQKIVATSTLPLAPTTLGGASFLEVLACPNDPLLVGERFEILETGLTQENGSIALPIEKSLLNTRGDLPGSLVGATYAVRPHWTLRSVFENAGGLPVLRSGKSAGSADLVSIPHHPMIPDAARWFYAPTFRGKSGGLRATLPGAYPADPVIPPGQGLMVFRQGPALRHVLPGEARQGLFRRPLRKGSNLLSLGHLSSGSFAKFLMNEDNGFVGSTAGEAQDQIRILHRDIWDRFILRPGLAGKMEWVPQGVAYPGNLQLSNFLQPGTAIWIEKGTADPDFCIPPIP